MSWIDAHSVRFHCVLDLVDNRLACSLDPKDLGNFDYVIGGSVFSDNSCGNSDMGVLERGSGHAFRYHNLLQAVALHQQFLIPFLSAEIVLFLDIDNRSVDTRDSLTRVDWSPVVINICCRHPL